MTVQTDINIFFEYVYNIRGAAVQDLVNFKAALVNHGVDEVGPGVYRKAEKNAWKINACDYVLRSRKDIVDLRSFTLLAESLQRDLIARGSAFSSAEVEGPAYWQTIGAFEREATRLVARASVREGV